MLCCLSKIRYRFGGIKNRFREKYIFVEKGRIFLNKKRFVIVKFSAEVRRIVYWIRLKSKSDLK